MSYTVDYEANHKERKKEDCFLVHRVNVDSVLKEFEDAVRKELSESKDGSSSRYDHASDYCWGMSAALSRIGLYDACEKIRTKVKAELKTP